MIRIGILLIVVSITGLVVAEQAKHVVIQFRLGEREPAKGLTEMTVEGSDRKVYLYEKVELTNWDIADASARKTQTGGGVEIVFTKEGEEKLAKLTEDNIGKLLGIVVDGKLISAPVIKTAIRGKGLITGEFSFEEAKRIADGILGK